MKIKRFFAFFCLIVAFFAFVIPLTGFAKEKIVYKVPVEETVEKGLYAFLTRAVTTAENDGAEAIIFEINTPGGAVDAATDIAKLLSSTNVKTIAFINKQALSAGAFIALNADQIYMVPGGTIGSAAIIDQQGNTAGKKAESFWFAAMQSAAKQNNRDPIYALAMADENVDLPKYGAEKGKLLTLTSDQALEVGYAEGMVKNEKELLNKLGYADADVRTMEESFAEKVARFLTHPIVISLLLTIGGLGLVLELYSPGFGVPGFLGITSLLLFFYGHYVAGLAGYEVILLFFAGIILVILELFLPHGISGAIGVIAVILSLFLAAADPVHLAISLLIAIVVVVVTSILMIKVYGKKMKFFKKIVLNDATTTEKGYVSNKNRLDLIGIVGVTVTPLRPAGTIVVDDERIDVVSEGAFIAKGVKVKVIKTEGPRIVVREI